MSSSTHSTVIIFGASGNVGSHTALAASRLGAKVYLALRDPSKSIADLDDQSEFPRVKADLTDKDSVERAARDSGATAAFVYAPFGNDGSEPKAIFEAMVKGGIEHVVFLSSSSVPPNPESVRPDDFISYHHAQTELALKSVPGLHSTIIRPGAFATNTNEWIKPIALLGQVQTSFPDLSLSYIAPRDIGDVAGEVLVHQGDYSPIYLGNSESISQRKAAEIIGQVAFGKKVEVKELTVDEHVELATKHGMPKAIISDVLKNLKAKADGNSNGFLEDPKYAENVVRFAKRPPTTFEQFVKENKGSYTPAA